MKFAETGDPLPFNKDRPRHERYMLIGLNGKWQVILIDMLAMPFKNLRADADYRLLPRRWERNAR